MAEQIYPKRPPSEPWGYFLTFTCYGVRLHGDARGSVDRQHNGVGSRYLEEDSIRRTAEEKLMAAEALSLGPQERETVLAEVVSSRVRQGWTLHAVHVRTTHVHIALTANVEPEIALGKLKSFASRALNERFGKIERRWARHGSTIWLWDPHRLQRAVDYVVREQGRPMELYVNEAAWEEYMGT
jgi:hypothetical protein